MEFIKKHYEKVILSAVLLGLVGVLVAMWFVIMADKAKMDNFKTQYIHGRGQPLPEVNLSRQKAVLARLAEPYHLDFSETNKLFNPVQWRKMPDGRVIKLTTGHELGPGAAVVTKITPLYFSIALVSVETNLTAPRYKVSVEHQAAAYPAQRHPRIHYASKGEKVSGAFTIVSVTGAPENPSALAMRLPGGEMINVEKDEPFRRVEGYSADVKYDPEKINDTDLRVGEQLNFAGDQYNIIAIDQNEVVLLAQSNQKKYVLRYKQ